MVVVDASVVTAALALDVDWARRTLSSGPRIAPAHAVVEVAHALRRMARLGEISQDAATIAHGDLLELDLTLVPYASLGPLTWAMRGTMSPYDAAYVAVAVAASAPLATFDRKLAKAARSHCDVLQP